MIRRIRRRRRGDGQAAQHRDGGVEHVNQIPRSRKGPVVGVGAISGADPRSGKIPADLGAQCRNRFGSVRYIKEAPGRLPTSMSPSCWRPTASILRASASRTWVAGLPRRLRICSRHIHVTVAATPRLLFILGRGSMGISRCYLAEPLGFLGFVEERSISSFKDQDSHPAAVLSRFDP